MKRCKHISKEEEEAAFQLQQVLDSVKNVPERKRIPKGLVNIDNKTRSGTSRAQYCRATPKIGSREMEQAAIRRKQRTDTSSRCGTLFVESQTSFCAIEPLLDTDKLIEELSSQADVLLADYQSQINQRRLDSSVQCHQQRREASEVAWQNARPNLMNGYISFMGDLYEESVCQICQLNTMKIRCYTCCKVLCAACDAARHTFDALHNRSAKMDDGSIKKLSPCETVSQCGRLTMEERFLPVILRCRNFNCGRLTNPAKEGGTKVIAVTVDGRHDVNIPSGWCSLCSEHTSALDVRNKRDLVASGFWPGSPTHSQGICIYAIGLFDLIETIKIYSPSLSLHAFVKTLDDMSARRGEEYAALLKLDEHRRFSGRSAFTKLLKVIADLNQVDGHYEVVTDDPGLYEVVVTLGTESHRGTSSISEQEARYEAAIVALEATQFRKPDNFQFLKESTIVYTAFEELCKHLKFEPLYSNAPPLWKYATGVDLIVGTHHVLGYGATFQEAKFDAVKSAVEMLRFQFGVQDDPASQIPSDTQCMDMEIEDEENE